MSLSDGIAWKNEFGCKQSNKKISSNQVLFEGQANEYAQLINDYPMSHEDAIAILKEVVEYKNVGYSTEQIISCLHSQMRKL